MPPGMMMPGMVRPGMVPAPGMMAGINPALAQHPAFAAAYQQQIQQQMMMQQQQQMAMVSGARGGICVSSDWHWSGCLLCVSAQVNHVAWQHTFVCVGWGGCIFRHGDSNWGRLCQALVCFCPARLIVADTSCCAAVQAAAAKRGQMEMGGFGGQPQPKKRKSKKGDDSDPDEVRWFRCLCPQSATSSIIYQQAWQMRRGKREDPADVRCICHKPQPVSVHVAWLLHWPALARALPALCRACCAGCCRA